MFTGNLSSYNNKYGPKGVRPTLITLQTDGAKGESNSVPTDPIGYTKANQHHTVNSADGSLALKIRYGLDPYDGHNFSQALTQMHAINNHLAMGTNVADNMFLGSSRANKEHSDTIESYAKGWQQNDSWKRQQGIADIDGLKSINKFPLSKKGGKICLIHNNAYVPNAAVIALIAGGTTTVNSPIAGQSETELNNFEYLSVMEYTTRAVYNRNSNKAEVITDIEDFYEETEQNLNGVMSANLKTDFGNTAYADLVNTTNIMMANTDRVYPSEAGSEYYTYQADESSVPNAPNTIDFENIPWQAQYSQSYQALDYITDLGVMVDFELSRMGVYANNYGFSAVN